MIKTNIEEKSRLWLGLFVLVLSVVYILATLGKTSWTAYIAIIFGYFLVGFLYIEGGIREYFRRKEYKRISFGDFIVWTTIFFGTVVLINTTLLFQTIRDSAPEWLITFVASTGVVAGVISGILGIVYIFTPRFK